MNALSFFQRVQSSSFDDSQTSAPMKTENLTLEAPPSPNSSRCNNEFEDDQIFVAFLLNHMLLFLPLSALVFLVGCQGRMKQRRVPSEAQNANPSDVFTHHMVAMEMVGVLAGACFCIGVYVGHQQVCMYSSEMFYITSCVKILFLMLACVDLHLAVVHPLTYLRLKNSAGVRIRAISVALVWLLFALWASVNYLCSFTINLILFFCLAGLVLAVVSFCCISVLWTLKRPAPGQKVREQADRSKRRAFCTIVQIMAAIWGGLVGMVILYVLDASFVLENNLCVMSAFAFWFTLPSSLVLPLLLLQRAAKQLCCKHRAPRRR